MKRMRADWIPKSRRWTVVQARGVLEALEQSGLAVTQFAARHGLGVARLYEWRRRLERERKTTATPARFTEVRVAMPSSAAIELVLREGFVLRFAGASRLDDAVAVLGRVAGR
jgi:transposase-like protein